MKTKVQTFGDILDATVESIPVRVFLVRGPHTCAPLTLFVYLALSIGNTDAIKHLYVIYEEADSSNGKVNKS